MKMLLCLFLCMLAVFFASHTLLADVDKSFAENAVLYYREVLKDKGVHNLTLLKKVVYMQTEHENAHVRFNIAEAVGELGDTDILEVLWSIVVSEQDPDVRRAAVDGMLNSEDKSAARYLIQLIGDEDVFVRRSAIFGCGFWVDESIKERMVKAFLCEADELNKITIAAALMKIGDNNKEEYFKVVLLTHPDMEARKYAIQMAHYYNIAIRNDFLKEAMNRENNIYVRIWTACVLAKQGDSSALLYLKNVLSDSKEFGPIGELQSEAAFVLCEIGEREYAYPFLLELLKNKNTGIRERAIEDLVEFKDYALTPILGNVLLNDEDIIIREIAAWAMGERKDELALPYLDQGLWDESAFVRTGVIVALYKILKTNNA